MEPWTELCWYGLRLSLLLGLSTALRRSKSTVSAYLSGAGLLCWCFYDLRQQLQRQRAELWKQMAVPLRVCAYAEQLGEDIPAGSAKDWGPWKLWTLDSAGVAAVLSSDFAGSTAARRFRDVAQRVQCLFAAKALLWGNDWSEDLLGPLPADRSADALLAANVQRCLPRFLRFCLMVSRNAPLDGFVFEVRGAPYSHDLPSFTATVRRVLAALSAADPAGANCLARRVAGRGWYFQFAREPIFVTTFAPCYDEKNPRYQFQQHPESCFILFQPEESFLRHDLPNDKPRSQTNWEHPVDVRDRIRANFLRHGREYRIPETTSYPPAEFIVAPLDVLKDPPVHFWLEGSAPSGR